MLFIGDSSNQPLSKRLSRELNIPVHFPDVHIFPDGERRVRIMQNVVDKRVLVLKSLSMPVDSNILEFCFLIDTLKRSGAEEVLGIVPYLGYSRADHIFRTGEGVPLEVVIKMLETSGLDKILLVDPHSIKIPELFHIPIITISALPLFAKTIKKIVKDHRKFTLVSPDMGGIRRIKILSELLDNTPYALINKDRDYESGEVVATGIVEGNISDTCFIVDDMISSGKTIVDAVHLLSMQGAKEIYLFATQPVFSEDAPKLLQKSPAIRVFVTDAIDIPKEKQFEKLEVLSIAELVSNKVRDWFEDE